ncbi:MAG: IclR family transcriptional regulator [Pseudomonadota bacterium]
MRNIRPKNQTHTERSERGSGVQSVRISLRVLQVLAESRGPMHLREITAASSLAPSQAHRYLRSFVEGGLVSQDAATGRYDLGVLALQLGLTALSRVDAVKLADEALEKLVEQTNMAGGVSVWGAYGQTCVRWRPSPNIIIANAALGTVFPMLTTATGRISLALMPKSITRPIVKRELAAAKKANRDIDMASVDASIEDLKTIGYCQVAGYSFPGLRSIAAPIFGADGELSAIIGLVGADCPEGQPDSAPQLLVSVAQDVSERAGFRGKGNRYPLLRDTL